jgi:hypothetical protein
MVVNATANQKIPSTYLHISCGNDIIAHTWGNSGNSHFNTVFRA